MKRLRVASVERQRVLRIRSNIRRLVRLVHWRDVRLARAIAAGLMTGEGFRPVVTNTPRGVPHLETLAEPSDGAV